MTLTSTTEKMLEKAFIQDFEKINAIAREVHKQHIDYRPDIFKHVKHPISKDYFDVLLSKGSLFVCRHNKEIIGYAVLFIKERDVEPLHKSKVLVLEQIAINQTNRSQGIGTKMMNEILEHAKENLCTGIELTVSPENLDAVRFYEKFGMTVKSIKYSLSFGL